MDNPPDDGPCEVTITAPSREWLHAFVRHIVEDRLAAAGHVDTMRTTYRWDEEVHDAIEARARLHTRHRHLPEIVARTKNSHPFAVPCVVASTIVSGDPDYLRWIKETT